MWSISYSLAGERSRTRSLTVFGLGRNGALVVNPMIITAAVLAATGLPAGSASPRPSCSSAS